MTLLSPWSLDITGRCNMEVWASVLVSALRLLGDPASWTDSLIHTARCTLEIPLIPQSLQA